MPELVLLALTGLTFGTGISIAALTIASYAIVIGAAFAYGAYQAAQAKAAARDTFNSSLKDRLVMTATTNAPRSRLYGRIRNVDGILFKATHGSKNEHYTFVVAIAGHEVDGFEDYYFNDQKLTLDGTGRVLTAPFAKTSTNAWSETTYPSAASGSFTLARPPDAGSAVFGSQTIGGGTDQYTTTVPVTLSGSTISYSGATVAAGLDVLYQATTVDSKARIRSFTGAPGQDISGVLIALGIPGITTAHKFGGIALLVVTLDFDVTAFAQGVPGMTAVVRGAKCFDPRSGLTAWTRNPALIANDWALYPYGGGASTADVHQGALIVAANACDVANSFTTNGTAVTDATYTCDVVAPTQTDPTQMLNEMVATMAGKYAWAGGQLMFKAGAYSAPVATIDETWLSGKADIAAQAGTKRQDTINIYRPSIADRAKAYVVVPIPAVRADAYVASDGQELPRDVTFLAITDAAHAQNVCAVLLRDSRQGLTITIPCNMRAYAIELFDVVSVTLPYFGWSAKAFEVLSRDYAPGSGVTLTMKETGASIFTPGTTFTANDAIPNSNLPLPWSVGTPSIVSLTSNTAALTDGSVVTRTRITWSFAADISVAVGGSFEVQFQKSTDASRPDWPSVSSPGGLQEATIVGLQANLLYVFRVRAINAIPVAGNWSDLRSLIISPPPSAGSLTFQQEGVPTGATDGDLWQVPSTGIVYRYNAGLAAWILFSSAGEQTLNLIKSSGMTVVGNAASKTTGAFGWGTDQVYTRDGYAGGAYCSAQLPGLVGDVVFGLNTDPATDANFTSIDFGWDQSSGIAGYIYESGTQVAGPFTLAALDVLAIVYDGTKVTYMQNGTVRRTVAAAAGLRLYFDTAFYQVGSALQKIQFGPIADLSAAIAAAAAAQSSANAAQATATAAAASAAAASAAAAAAQSTAASAIAQLSTIASDNVLSAGEKPVVILDRAAIANEQAGIDAQATAAGITTELGAYDASIAALTSYLSGLGTPAWNDTTTDTVIVGPTFRQKFLDVYAARQVLLNRIAYIAGLTATWPSVTGTGRPQDNATVGATLGVNVSGSINSGNAASLLTVGGVSTAVAVGVVSGGRIEVVANAIKVYDPSNVVRVKIGDLSA